MAAKEKEYQRLPGKGRRPWGRSELWLGRDHLLLVDSNRFAEDYKRFYYRDIQMISVCENARRILWGVVWCVVTGLALLICLTAEAPLWFTWPFTGFFLMIVLSNWLRGPTCTVSLRT